MQVCTPVIACALVIAMAPVPQPAVGANPISQAIRKAWDGAKGNMQASANQMPEADYAFKPVEQVRTFGQILAHVAGANYVFCSAARGTESPFTEGHFEKNATTKAAIVKSLSDSIAYCDVAYAGLTDAKAAESVAMPFGMDNAPRASALIGNTGHLQEHYGNLVTYFRIKGMVPPSSKR
jgi:DinB family protein